MTAPKIHPSLLTLETSIENLVSLEGNPNMGDVEAVMRSYERFGQLKPIVGRTLPNGATEITAGNTQLAAARRLGWETIAVLMTDHDSATAKAFAIADNRSADLGSTDDALLASMLQEIEYDSALLAAASYSKDEIAELIASLEGEAEDDDTIDDLPEVVPSHTKKGTVWLLGDHSLICGDARDPKVMAKLVGKRQINLAFTSPPYAEQREYDESSGFRPIPPSQYVDWWEPLQANIAQHMAEDGSFFVNIKPSVNELDTELYVFDLVLAHVRRWGWHFATEFCWERGGMPSRVMRRFKNQFEPVYQFTHGDWKIRPDNVMSASEHVPIPLGVGGGSTNWANDQGTPDFPWFKDRNGPGMAFPGNRLPTFSGSHEALGHRAAFPVGLPEFFIKAYSDEGDVILDPFMGSGSTLLAAHRQDRIGLGVELSPAYCDMICARFERHTGIKPKRGAKTISFLAE